MTELPDHGPCFVVVEAFGSYPPLWVHIIRKDEDPAIVSELHEEGTLQILDVVAPTANEVMWHASFFARHAKLVRKFLAIEKPEEQERALTHFLEDLFELGMRTGVRHADRPRKIFEKDT